MLYSANNLQDGETHKVLQYDPQVRYYYKLEICTATALTAATYVRQNKECALVPVLPRPPAP